MPCVRRVRQADVTCGNVTQVAVHDSLSKARSEVASQLEAEAARASTSWHHRRHIVRILNRLAPEGNSPSRVCTGGDQSSGQGSSIHATASGEAAGGPGGQ